MGDEDTSSKTVKVWGLIALALAVPVYFWVSHISDPGKGRAAAVSLDVMVIIVRAFWILRLHLWFWIAIGLVVSCHIALITMVAWSATTVSAPALAPIGIADFLLVYGLIKLIEKSATQTNRV
jgi:hypothetical protein